MLSNSLIISGPLEQFQGSCEARGNLIPLYRSIPFGDHTPETAYHQWVKEDERDAPSFLFESVEPGLQQGRFSVVGAQPRMEIVAYENMVTVINHREGRRTEEFVEDPMVVPQRIMGKLNPQRLDELPEAFCRGWAGYFSYDTVRYVEKMLPFSRAPKDDRNLPDVHLGLYDQAKGCILVASSPEILTRVRKRKITSRPLAGTFRRWKTPEEDYILENQLLRDEKQCAENIMLVDLAWNDVGKVSKPGTVCVDKLRDIERYSHVMHISSTVTGELLDHLTSLDALRAAHPVGTVTGAPKVLYTLFCI